MKCALVTGGSSGIGRAVVQRLLEDGFSVLNLDIKAPSEVAPKERFIQVDLMDSAAIEAAMQIAVREHNVLYLVNNAGMIRPALLEDTGLEDFRAVCRLNEEAPMLLLQHLLPGMKKAGFGRVVNISSRAALGKEVRTAYAASKAALLGMTRTWALELARYGITVNAIGPGPIATELFQKGNPPESPRTKRIIETIPVQRLGKPEDVAHAAAFFLDERSGFTTGQTVYVCGGMTVGLSAA